MNQILELIDCSNFLFISRSRENFNFLKNHLQTTHCIIRIIRAMQSDYLVEQFQWTENLSFLILRLFRRVNMVVRIKNLVLLTESESESVSQTRSA